jgi:uncharacterized protein
MMPPQPFRILSLDGGGEKGAFSAAFHAEVERRNPGTPLASHFDLICGTSTGGIIALGFGLGLSARDILKFYRTEGPKIVPNTGTYSAARHTLRHLFLAKHDQARLRKSLTQVLGDRELGASSWGA